MNSKERALQDRREEAPALSALRSEPWEGRGGPVLHACSEQAELNTTLSCQPLGSRRKTEENAQALK